MSGQLFVKDSRLPDHTKVQNSFESTHPEQQLFPELQTGNPFSKVFGTRRVSDFLVFPDFGVFAQILQVKHP